MESSRLISEAVSILPSVPGLCTPAASVNALPSVLYLLTCVLREVALIKDSSSQKTVSATLQALKQLTTSPYTHNPKCSKDWVDLLQRFWLLIYMTSIKEGRVLCYHSDNCTKLFITAWSVVSGNNGDQLLHVCRNFVFFNLLFILRLQIVLYRYVIHINNSFVIITIKPLLGGLCWTITLYTAVTYQIPRICSLYVK